MMNNIFLRNLSDGLSLQDIVHDCWLRCYQARVPMGRIIVETEIMLNNSTR